MSDVDGFTADGDLVVFEKGEPDTYLQIDRDALVDEER